MHTTTGKAFPVWVSFLSVPMDVRKVNVCDAVSIETFDILVRERFRDTYEEIPRQLLFFTRKQLRGYTRGVLCDSVRGFMYSDCEVYVWPIADDLMYDRRLPLEISPKTEKRALGVEELQSPSHPITR